MFTDGTNVGECRRRPPQPMLQPVMKDNKLTQMKIQSWEPVAFFPPIRRDSWCGKFAPRAAEAPLGGSTLHKVQF